MFIGSKKKLNNEKETVAGGASWFGPNDAKNIVIKVPASQQQTARTADVVVTLVAIQHVPRDQNLWIVSSKSTTRLAMMRNLENLEDEGWVGVADCEPLEALAAELKSRPGHTIFVDVASHENPRELREGLEAATRMAGEGLQERGETQVTFRVQPELRLVGIKLAKLTQRLAYTGIKERREAVSWKATETTTSNRSYLQ